MSERVVAVVGGGLAGAAAAVHLLRRLGEGDRVVLCEPHGIGQGVAFAPASREHVLNVTADRMSLLPDDPHDFVRYLEDACVPVGSIGFAPRAIYGAYVAARLDDAATRTTATFERLRVTVTDIAGASGRWRLVTDGGHSFDADRVVLATGHGPPVVPAALAALVSAGDLRVVVDPYAAGALAGIATTASVLVVGTGLTAVDVAVSLLNPRRSAPVHALSPSGRWPTRHLREVRWEGEAPSFDPLPAAPTLDELEAWLLSALARARAARIPWQAVIDALRPRTSALWANLSDTDRRRFVRERRSAWNRLRHRMPAAQADALRASTEAGDLVTHAGTLLEARSTRDGVACAWEPLPAAGAERGRAHRTFDHVVVCAGRSSDLRRMGAPWPSLIAQGLAVPCPLGLGVLSDAQGNLVAPDADPTGLAAIGGLLRPALFESTAVPEIARQAAALAARLSPPAP